MPRSSHFPSPYLPFFTEAKVIPEKEDTSTDGFRLRSTLDLISWLSGVETNGAGTFSPNRSPNVSTH